jgi:hypothetical protein
MFLALLVFVMMTILGEGATLREGLLERVGKSAALENQQGMTLLSQIEAQNEKDCKEAMDAIAELKAALIASAEKVDAVEKKKTKTADIEQVLGLDAEAIQDLTTCKMNRKM